MGFLSHGQASTNSDPFDADPQGDVMPPKPVPLYAPNEAKPSFQLRYSWTGWPSTERFHSTLSELIESTKPHWESDGLRVIQHQWTEEKIQILFSTVPDVTPVFVAARVKGRLDHAIREAGLNMPFSRKVSLRSVGDNTREDVEGYIRSQVSASTFADPRFAEMLAQFTTTDPAIDLSQPAESARGRYWYNLHLVLVTDERYRFTDSQPLRLLFDGVFRIARAKGHAVSSLSVMPDHRHVALRPGIDESPLSVARAYQNNLAWFLNHGRIWTDSCYVGTFGEYTTQAIRNITGR